MVAVALAYLGLVSAIMIWRGISVSPDYLLVLMVPLALLAGKFVRFLKDWVPFIALFLGWEAMRGIVGKTTPPLGAITYLLDVEKWLFFGHVPTVELQKLFGQDPSSGAPIVAVGYVAMVVYFCHFIFPVALGMVMWLVDRVQFLRYTMALLGMALVAFVIYVLVPTAPPWYAQDQNYICCFNHVLLHSIPSAISPYYQSLNPNHYAAFPSLHAAFPFLTFLALRRLYPRAAWLALAWCFVVWFSVVFLGEHYVVDVIGGIALASAAWLVMMRLIVPRVAALQEAEVPVDLPVEAVA